MRARGDAVDAVVAVSVGETDARRAFDDAVGMDEWAIMETVDDHAGGRCKAASRGRRDLGANGRGRDHAQRGGEVEKDRSLHWGNCWVEGDDLNLCMGGQAF